MDNGLPNALSAMSIDDKPRGGGGGEPSVGYDHRDGGGHGGRGRMAEPQLPAITPDDLPPDMREAFNQLDPEQQRQALEMLAQQQYEQQQMEEMRPEEHFLTIALNGTILGATEMVTGFPPSNLLMTSAFDSVHEDELLGLHAIKTHFWEKDQPDVEVYLRRQTVEGEWTWLVAKVVSYIDSPVPGIIIHETLVRNEHVAVLVSRITRIASLLLQAVEASLFGPEAGCETAAGEGDNVDPGGLAAALGAGEPADGGAAEIQAMLSEMGVDLTDSENPLRELMEAANGMGRLDPALAAAVPDNAELSRKKNADLLDYLKTGASLDLSKIILTEGEAKLVALVLTGRLQIEDLGPLLYLALNSPEMDLVAATDEFYHLSEVQLRGNAQSPSEQIHLSPPQLAVINLSYTNIGDYGMDSLSEFIYSDNAALKTLDLSFCNISSQGLLSLCHGLKTRTSRGLPPLQALSLAGNTIKADIARQLGRALSTDNVRQGRKGGGTVPRIKNGSSTSNPSLEQGLKLLHLGSTSITPSCLTELLAGLGPTCPLQELKLHSNKIGPGGASVLVNFLDGKCADGRPVLPKLNRIDMSYNELGDHGTTKLTRAISKRAKIGMTEVSLSGNDMGSKGIESIMNKFLQHKLVTLNLDNNSIGDQGCQLVAASLPSIPSLSRLNLAFNDIGCRGMATLMRSLVGCESITSLGLSGNVMKISGAIAMGFTLAQHPRLSVLELDNCCLSQVAQCHIVAGIISNRWVPMKVMQGFRAGPPMVAIGALEIAAQHMTNEECFRLRRDIQMKTLLQWMENNRNNNDPGMLTNDVLSGGGDQSGAPSQSAYLRMLDWLGRIPFDESELMDLRKYFYDISGGDGDQKSESNLKHRGDILAALASDVVEEILENEPVTYFEGVESIGLDLNKADEEEVGSPEEQKSETNSAVKRALMSDDCVPKTPEEMGEMFGASIEVRRTNNNRSTGLSSNNMTNGASQSEDMISKGSMSTISMSMGKCDSQSRGSRSSSSMASMARSDSMQYKARITMFPQFSAKLDNLKAVAQEMMDNESDPVQQDVIAQQFAEASLTILRQLRYHCMESGLDGWRQGKLRRKVLIVDDSVVTRKMVARAFEKANFIVDTAEDGVKGVNKMKESIYDIAFMDIDMPVMNGFDATKALRMWEDSVRPGARQPICALTAAHVDDFDRTELMKFKEAGLDVMESKPCNIPRLFKVVDDVSPMFSDLSINASQYDVGGVSSENN
mmetsp:Transcript_14596/g.31751  ORF Transcript_14596/g.31751 Transcript_14596/m.31751 type:complete len:1240 (-) Transcript_14596:40-3759(-)|eukprot:CAMPEP_0172552214 /NCGR_PEP_ID=MMETSP1067-20121228/43688_1 /TAXON_ID=265564 ORGANISM="Thalassiosira punctigera, Strain Tpunct2005C2" /NCGR_SAMPLE_ID=MMETSP1067 /ASSEMBLY_ACC=CAM_ASM_000444 /LENGTH=1239 /DNA_ID=CAMNT_0013340141 /DNA_START=276 /DNA_END=3995 /DNA_ORIENTATION=+